MVKTIGNPLSWTAHVLGSGSSYVASGTREIGGEDTAPVVIRKLELSDLKIALRKGAEDLAAFRSDVVFICVVYPVVGVLLTWFAFNRDLLPLVLPLISGFALIGPVAALGLYEMSRRREAGEEPGWGAAFGVFGSPSAVPIFLLGLYMLGIYLVWMLTAYAIYSVTLGPEPPVSVLSFLGDVFGTGAGWALIVVGMSVGFLFAAGVLAISIVSFPMLLDRHVGVLTAVSTSVKVVTRNPVTAAVWGLIVAVSLALGMATLFIGLVFVLPILGHATWHLYRRAIGSPEPKP